MVEEKGKIIGELKKFHNELRSYKSLLDHLAESKIILGHETNDRDKLRERLVRRSGRLKPIIIKLTKKQYITRAGITWDMWDMGLDPYPSLPENEVSLARCIDATNEAIGKLETTPLAELEPQRTATEPPKAFIAHGGASSALSKLKSFLEALGVEPLVVEEQPSEGRSVGENVDWYARQADCAIILATKGDIDGKTGKFIPRGNVLIEIGKLQELFKDRIIYLLQAGTKLPTNINEKVRARFTSEKMDDALIKIAKELKKFGILRAVKP
jgi:predicted nucleotide-binding protein